MSLQESKSVQVFNCLEIGEVGYWFYENQN